MRTVWHFIKFWWLEDCFSNMSKAYASFGLSNGDLIDFNAKSAIFACFFAFSCLLHPRWYSQDHQMEIKFISSETTGKTEPFIHEQCYTISKSSCINQGLKSDGHFDIIKCPDVLWRHRAFYLQSPMQKSTEKWWRSGQCVCQKLQNGRLVKTRFDPCDLWK